MKMTNPNFTVKKRLLSIEPYRPGKPIAEVKRELGIREVVKLASNENPYGPSPRVLKAIQSEAKSVNRYPDGNCFYLRQALAKQLQVKEDQIIFGNGSDEIIVMVLRACVGEGDEVILAKPSFLIYEIAAKIEGATVKAIPLRHFYYDLDKMLDAVTDKTKVIFIGNPDNPAGTYVSERQLKDFLNQVRRDIVIVVDEAYFEYVIANDYPDTIRLLKNYPNLVITRTFSKMYGLAGLRIGYGIARSQWIELLNRIRDPFNVNSLAQAAALACIKDRGYYRRIGLKVEEQRQFLYQRLAEMGLAFVPSVTNFILIDLQDRSARIVEELLKRGVIVRDMKFWGMPTFIRVTIGAEKENRKFIKALAELLS